MFKKWFNKNKKPTKDGNKGPKGLSRLRTQKVFEIELSNMEGEPIYEITEKLTIGKELGDIVISDSSISPRHATFSLQDEVLSILDHGSINGTFINERKIDSGKNIILEESDTVRLGDLEIKIKVKMMTVPEEEIPEVPKVKDATQKVEDIKEKLKSFENKKNEKSKKMQNKKKKTSLNISAPVYSANAVVRVFAVTCDLLLTYAMLIVFSPFDEFRDLINYIPDELSSLLEIDWKNFWAAILEDFPILGTLLDDINDFVPATTKFVSLFMVFGLFRLLSTLFFGVSFSEYFLGVRTQGNALWNRIGGVIRVILGLFTWPFVIFDIPAVISRRTLKEFITLTNIYVPSKVISFVGFVVFVPATLVVMVMAPLFQGLEPPQMFIFNEVIQKRAKVKLPEDAMDAVMVEEVSSVLKLKLNFNKNDLRIIPSFKFQTINDKSKLTTGLHFYQEDLKKDVRFEVMKSFDLKALLSVGMRGNVFLYEKYPNIHSFITDNGLQNSFKKPKTQRGDLQFATEVIQLTKTALTLNLENAIDVIQMESPLLKWFVDYKSALLALFEYKDIDEIGVIKIGDTQFLRVSYMLQKPFDLLIPLVRGEGKIYKVSFDGKQDYQNSASKFYKFNINKSSWNFDEKITSQEQFNTFNLYDLFSKKDFLKSLDDNEKAQQLYAYSFETSKSILEKNDDVVKNIWIAELKKLISIVELIPEKEIEEETESIKQKLMQNFKDLNDALENNNNEYFGITNSISV